MKQLTLMGILNVTPDSFSDGGLYLRVEAAVARAREMVKEGAEIIDIGGESTRPGSENVSVEEELKRVIPVIAAIKKELPKHVQISIDTNKSEVASKALEAGAAIVNSLGGFLFDPKLAEVVAKANAKIVIYHIKGEPKTMQQGEITYIDVITEIADFFTKQIETGEKEGIKKGQFILDPGIGFGKTVKHNLEIIKRLHELQSFGLPILIGVSRKSHLGALLKEKLQLTEVPAPAERLEASLAETAIAVRNGATMVRTHDVKETKKFLAVLEELL